MSSENKISPEKFLTWTIYILALVGGLIHMWNSAVGTISAFQMRPLHLAIIGALAVLVDLEKLIKSKKSSSVVKVLFVILNLFMLFCVLDGVTELLFNYDEIARTAGKITPSIVICSTLLIISILYFTERKVGLALPVISFIFLIYALFGHLIPGILGHSRFSYNRIAYFLYVNGNGIFGTAIDTSARYLVLFMIMGQFIELSGTSKLFMALADLVSSKVRGGAAKSSVVASALFGTISGTPIANVMVTGAFTIPMMKKSGFEDSFAGAVEATASTGGLIMPPMMGAGAFVMAELLGVGYDSIMVAAIIPAILYYFSIYVAIDFYAAKNNIGKVEHVDVADVKKRIRTYIHTIIPLCLFIVSVVMGYSVFRSAIICIVLTPFVAAIRKETRMSFKQILDGIVGGMKDTISLGAACACAGIIVGVISLTGFGFSFAQLLGLFENIPIMALIITMLVCIVMGMGMPAVASYMITATIAATTLINMGFDSMAVHMFIFYFSCFSSVTPPVALASYAAAGLAGTNPMTTGWKAFRLALVAFICPYFFVYSPALIGQSGALASIALLPTTIIGTFAFVCGISGYFFGRMNNIFFRILMILGGCLLIDPGIATDLIGVACIAMTAVYRFLIKKGPDQPRAIA